MDELMIKDKKIEDMIYEIRGKQVMLDSEMSATKWHCYLYDKIIAHYDIGKPISVFNNFIMERKIIWN